MAKHVVTVSEAGFVSQTDVGDYEIAVDAGGEDAPDTLDTLLAAYGSDYVPALRTGAEQRGVGDLGRIEIDVVADLDGEDKLDEIQFDIRTEAAIDHEQAEEIITRANQLSKVQDALRADLEARMAVEADAF